MTRPLSASAIVAASCLAAALALTAAACAGHPGSAGPVAWYSLSFLALVALIFPRPRSYAYTFFAGLLFLGFWPKFVAQAVWGIALVEPIGDFSGTEEQWSDALEAAAWGAFGAVLARVAQLWLARRHGVQAAATDAGVVPSWFARHRQLTWVSTLALVVTLNALNARFAFFTVGMNPRLVLPLHLTVVPVWLVNIGLALWIATLVRWQLILDRRSLPAGLLGACAEAFLASVSSASRLTFVLRAGAYFVALAEDWKTYRDAIGRRTAVIFAAGFLILLSLSIAAVFWIRVQVYYGYDTDASQDEPFTSHLVRTMKKQIPNLILHRWVGLEGVLAVSAVPQRGSGLLYAAVADDPRHGAQSLYQRHAKPAHLAETGKFTFLANAGVVAILWFSGSFAVVLAGMALVAAIMMLTEEFARRLTANPFLLAVAGAALANVVVQTTFPYLTAVFLAQLCVAIVFLGALQRLAPAGKRGR